jgi:type III secretion protein R
VPRERAFFIGAARRLWPPQQAAALTDRDLLVLVPAFTVSELTEAFKLGFLLFLPFVVIDLVVSNILLAMGMMMVSPMTISLPFKLFLFVVVDGWQKLIEGLVLSYARQVSQ